MSETPSVEIEQDEWNGVYYDPNIGEFFILEVAEDTVTFINAFEWDRDDTTLTHEEFHETVEGEEFREVPEDVVNCPEELVIELLGDAMEAVSGDRSGFVGYSPIEVDFAVRATDLSVDDEAPFRDRADTPLP